MLSWYVPKPTQFQLKHGLLQTKIMEGTSFVLGSLRVRFRLFGSNSHLVGFEGKTTYIMGPSLSGLSLVFSPATLLVKESRAPHQTV